MILYILFGTVCYWYFYNYDRKRRKKRKAVYIETQLSDTKSNPSPLAINIKENSFNDRDDDEEGDRFERKEDALQLNLNSPTTQIELGRGGFSFDEVVPTVYSPSLKPLPFDSIITKQKANPMLSSSLSAKVSHKVYIIDESLGDSNSIMMSTSKSNFLRKGIDSASFDDDEKSVYWQDAYGKESLDFSSTNQFSVTNKDANAVGRVGSTLTNPPAKKALPQKMNHAVLIIKPHAVNAGISYLVTASLASANVKIVTKKIFTGGELLTSKLYEKHRSIDRRYSAEDTSVQSITFTSEEGKKTLAVLGESITAAVWQKRVFNCKQACAHLKINESILHEICNMSAMRVKLRKGLHITRLDSTCINDIMMFVYADLKAALEVPIYVINGFYEAAKTEFESPSSSIQFMCIEWDGNQLPWSDFMIQLIGDRDPSKAISSSIRGTAFTNWRKLGLMSQPTEERNCVYVSSSAADGFVDRFNWVEGTILYSDALGSRMISANIPASSILKWIVTNPVINGKSYLDHMYGLDSDECVAKSLTFVGELKMKLKLILHFKE